MEIIVSNTNLGALFKATDNVLKKYGGNSKWDLFQCEAVEKAKHHWDGHTSQDVATRLRQALDDTIKALQDKRDV